MGREDFGSSNVASTQGSAQGSPENSTNHTANGLTTEEEQEVLEGKVVGHEPEEKIIEAEVQNLNGMKLSSPSKTASVSATNEMMNGNSLSRPPEPDNKMVNTHIVERKHRYPSTRSHFDEEDNWSLSSSIATSVRTTKVTVPVAPRFNCVDRLQRRKEFYSKLEEKHKALEKEKHDYEARVKEEDEAALKLLRKNMSYKANPVPSFYREGPPAKVELKKIPVTRAKSPNFSRRKSCGDAGGVTKTSPSGKVVRSRHSTGATKVAAQAPSPLSSTSKTQNCSPVPMGSGKTRATRSQIRKANEADICCEEGKANADMGAAS